MKPFEVLKVLRSRRQPARGEPRRAGRRHPRRHGLRDDEPAARRASSAAPAPRPPAWRAWPLAGKTGTVDNNTDAWFIGFDPDITVGVWIGLRREEVDRAARRQGAVAALPIWMEFMKAYIDGRPDKDDPPEFEAPGNIVFLAVDKSTGGTCRAETPGGDQRSVHLRHPAAAARARRPASHCREARLRPWSLA